MGGLSSFCLLFFLFLGIDNYVYKGIIMYSNYFCYAKKCQMMNAKHVKAFHNRLHCSKKKYYSEIKIIIGTYCNCGRKKNTIQHYIICMQF